MSIFLISLINDNLVCTPSILTKKYPQIVWDKMVAKGFFGDASTYELFVDLVAEGKLDPSLRQVVKKNCVS